MKTFFVSVVLITLVFSSCKDKDLTGKDLLEKAIKYHDPEGNWETFNSTFDVRLKVPNSSDRLSTVSINLPEDFFSIIIKEDSTAINYTLKKGDCSFSLNNDTNVDEATAKANNINCKNGNLWKNFYTFLYGLPMKLKDPGTKIDEIIETKTFKGKEYLVLKVTHEEEVGVDLWYFYFDPITYAMEMYQFFKKDENGNQKNDSGLYVVLSQEVTINNIKMPKIRAWYANKGDVYLSTDYLE